MRTVSFFDTGKQRFSRGEVVTFRVKIENIEGRDKTVLEEIS